MNHVYFLLMGYRLLMYCFPLGSDLRGAFCTVPHQFIQGHPVQAAEFHQVFRGGDRTAYLPPGDGLAGYVETLRNIQLRISMLFSQRR